MEHVKYVSVIACIFIVTITTVSCFPTGISEYKHKRTDGHADKEGLRVANLDRHGDGTYLLRKWLKRIENTEMVHDNDGINSRRKRDSTELDINNNATDEAAFEEYEREYLLQQIENDLKTLYYHKEYDSFLKNETKGKKPDANHGGHVAPPSAQPATPDYNRVDPLLEAKLRELHNMTNGDLDRIFRNVRRAIEDGVADNSIASLCCQIAG